MGNERFLINQIFKNIFLVLNPFLPGSGSVTEFDMDPDPEQIFSFRSWIWIYIKYIVP